MDAGSDFLHARYEVQGADGTVFGPVSAWTLAEWRETRRVADTDLIRRVNGPVDVEWVALCDSNFVRNLPDEPLVWDPEA